MKDHWYLISSLPYLHFGDKPPMGVEEFRAACIGWLTKEEMRAVNAVLENREPFGDAARAWWNSEVQLRDAMVRVRAKNRGVDAARFLKPYDGFSMTIEKLVTDAFVRPDPMEREMEIDRARWMLADERAVSSPFGFAAVLAFAVKVRIAERWASMDEEAGMARVEELILSATTEDV